MSFKLNFDAGAFEREVQMQAQSAIEEVARARTNDLERLRQQYQGHSVSEIKPVLETLFSRDGGRITDPELTEYAQAISDGTRIEVRAERIRW